MQRVPLPRSKQPVPIPDRHYVGRGFRW